MIPRQVLGYTTVESLRLISSSGNDTIEIDSLVAWPFVTSLEDTGGTANLLDFTDFAGGITLDLDTPAVQSLNAVVGGGPLLQLLSTYENFTGTSGNDTVYADPLVADMRILNGGGGSNTLNFDGKGAVVTDNGLVLTTPGFANVNYSNFEKGLTTNGPVRYLDNGDSGYTKVGGFTTDFDIIDRQAFGNDQDYAPLGSAGTATWSFTGLPRGVYYVSATWTKREGRATNATYAIHNGALATDPLLATTVVSQRQDPSQFTEGISEWQHLAVVEITGNGLTVVLDANGANGAVAADAIRLEPVATPLIIDNGDAGFTSFTDPANSTKVSQSIFGLFNDFEYAVPGIANTATWTANGLADGRYLVSATWVGGDQLTQHAGYTLAGGAVPVNAVIDQELGPYSFVEANVAWQNLGVVNVVGGVLTVTLDASLTTPGSGNERVVADAIRIVAAPAVAVFDGVTAVPDDPNTFVNVGTTPLGANLLHTITVQNTGQSHLELSDLNVVGTLINNFGLTGGFLLGSPFVATSVPPGGSTTFQVKLNASTQGTILGTSAFKTNDIVAPEYNFGLTGIVQRPVSTVIDDGDAVGYTQGAFLAGPRPEGYQFDVDYAFGGAAATATWSFTGLVVGARYQVAATWSPDTNRTTAAPYSINGGAAINKDQTVSPNDFAANQYHNQIPAPPWEVLDTVTVGIGGTITVTLSNAGLPADRLALADAIRIVPAAPNVVTAATNMAVINNGDPGYACTANCNLSVLSVNPGATSAFQEEVQYMAADGSGDAATWNFDLDQGVYEIAVSWSPGANRTTVAHYSIDGGAPVIVDQSVLAAADIVVDGKPFQKISGVSNFTVAALSKSVTIRLSDFAEAGRIVIADAVVVRRIGGLPLLAAGSPGAGSDASAIVTADDLSVLVAAAADRWEAAGVSGSQLAFLRNAKVVISDLPENRLGMAAEFDGVITVDVNAAGFGWFIDRTPGSDEEFAVGEHADEQLAVAGRGAEGRIDLLTVLIHEMGHLAGLPDLNSDSHDSMASSLAASLRRSLTVSTVVTEGHTNPVNSLDVNNDGSVSPLDALIIINELNTNGSQVLVGSATGAPYLDTSRDGHVSSLDVLLVINELNSRQPAGEGEGLTLANSLTVNGTLPSASSSLDAAMASLDSRRIAVIPGSTNRLDESTEDSADSFFASLGDEARDESQVFPVADLDTSDIDRAEPVRLKELDELFAALGVE